MAAQRGGGGIRLDGNSFSGSANVLIVLRPPSLANRLFGEGLAGLAPLAASVTVVDTWEGERVRRLLADVHCLITGWGVPDMPPGVLEETPRLRCFVHAGGAVSVSARDAAAQRGLVVRDVGQVNAIPVAEFAVSMILLAGKDVFSARELYRRERGPIDRELRFPRSGNFGRVVGIVGASRIGRLVIEALHRTDLAVLVADPFLTEQEAAALGCELVSLDDLCRRSDVLSLHAPELPETRGMLSRDLLALLPDGATVINTARGALIDQDALVDEVRSRRLRAVLDVTEPDVLPPNHPLYELDGVFLTPHVAGSMGTELRRMGDAVIEIATAELAG